MATDELTAQLSRDVTALKAALAAAVHYHEAWHAASSVNIKNGRNPEVDRVLDKAADDAKRRS